MSANPYQLLVECTRGPLVESIHFGAITVVDAQGHLVASIGDPDLYANLRSSSKPFQALPLIENGGVEMFGLRDEDFVPQVNGVLTVGEFYEKAAGSQIIFT